MKKLVVILTLGLWATLSVRAADTVELLPGKITGSISLSTETLNNGTLYANATDGSGSAQVSFTGSSFSLVVPAGKTWRLALYAYPQFPSSSAGSAYGYLYANLPDEVTVGADQTVSHDLNLVTARIVTDVQVANGTLNGLPTLQANGNTGGTTPASFSFYGQYTDYAVVLPSSSVGIYGSASVTSTTGGTSAQTLSSQSVSVPTSGATATWSLDAAFAAGAIQGEIAFTGAATPTSTRIDLSNSANTLVERVYYSGNEPFDFTNLLPDTYHVRGYVSFPNSQLYHYTDVTAVAGSITPHDLAGTVSSLQTSVAPTGFLTAEQISGGYFYANWTVPNPNPDALSRTSYGNWDNTNKRFANIVVPGEWKFNQFSVSDYDYSTPGVYLSYGLGIYEYYPTAVTVEEGVNQVLPTMTFDTTQTELTFDVVEAPGATSETLITSANLNGYVTTYNGNQPSQQLSISASVSGTASPRQRVRIVGVPGTYAVQTFGYVDGSRVSFGNFNLELKAPLPTPVGTDVEVAAGGGVDLVFDNVITAGVTTASQLPVGPALPPGYSGVNTNGVKAYYSVSTTATFDGYIDITIDYTDDTVPAELESQLKLFTFDDATQSWIDVTIEVDEANNRITGTAPTLALFAIGVAHAPELGDAVVPTEVLAGEEFTLSVPFSDVDSGESFTALIDWGDGTTSEGEVDLVNGVVNAPHTYEAGGTYTGSITLTDVTGNVVSSAFTVVVTGGDDTAPVLTLAAEVSAEATGPDGAVVDFIVTALDDTDGEVAVETSIPSGSVFALGSTTVIATATDAAGNTIETEFTVIVVDTTAPEIAAVEDLTLEAASAEGAAVSFAAAASDLVDGNVAVSSSIPTGTTFPIGTTTVELTATDAAGNPSSSSFTVTVQDTTAPTINSVTPSVGSLWPPNHQMVAITLSADVVDAGGATTVRIVDVTSSEPDTGTGRGDRAGDIEVTGDLSLNLRAERAGKGSGRVYTITVDVTDASGNVSQATTTVTVPHDRGGKSDKSDKSKKSGKSEKSGKSGKDDKKKSEKGKSFKKDDKKDDRKSDKKSDKKDDRKKSDAKKSSSKSGPRG